MRLKAFGILMRLASARKAMRGLLPFALLLNFVWMMKLSANFASAIWLCSAARLHAIRYMKLYPQARHQQVSSIG